LHSKQLLSHYLSFISQKKRENLSCDQFYSIPRIVVRAAPTRDLRRKTPNRANFEMIDVTDLQLQVLEVLANAMKKRLEDPSFNSRSHLCPKRQDVVTNFLEVTSLLTPAIHECARELLALSPKSDGVSRLCHRALVNDYSTEKVFSSKIIRLPTMVPHRDPVGDADVSIVIGLSERSTYSGALLYVSNKPDGSFEYIDQDADKVRLRSATGVDVHRGRAVILYNHPCHFVSYLQNGRRSSLVLHMRPDLQ